MVQTVVLVVGVPMAGGIMTRVILTRRYGAEHFTKRIVPVFPGLSTRSPTSCRCSPPLGT